MFPIEHGDMTASYLSSLDPQKHLDPVSGGSAVAKGKEILLQMNWTKTLVPPFGGEFVAKIGSRN